MLAQVHTHGCTDSAPELGCRIYNLASLGRGLPKPFMALKAKPGDEVSQLPPEQVEAILSKGSACTDAEIQSCGKFAADSLVVTIGSSPPPAPTPPRSALKERAMLMANALRWTAGPGALERAWTAHMRAIRAGLREGQRVQQLSFCCIGRIDVANKLRDIALDVFGDDVGEILVGDSLQVLGVLVGWGTVLLGYWVE